MRSCPPALALTLLMLVVPALGPGGSVIAQSQGPALQGVELGLHFVGVQHNYGENVDSPGGLGVEVGYAPSRFFEAEGVATMILNGLESGNWRTFEAALHPRYLLGSHLLLEATAAIGYRSSSDFAQYTFGAFGGGLDFFLGRRFALSVRLDRVEPFDDSSPGYRRIWGGFVLHLGH